MRKFFVKTLIFLCPFAVLLGCFERGLSSVENTYTFKKQLLESKSSDLQVLVLGSSHSYHGINPQRFSEKAFNMAMLSQDYYYDCQLLSAYLDRMPNLKLVLIEVSYFRLYNRLVDSPEYWRAFYYKQFFNIPSNKLILNYDPRSFSLFALYGNRDSLHFALRRFKVKQVAPVNECGWVPYPNQYVQRHLTMAGSQARVALHHSGMKEENFAVVEPLLESMLAKLQARHIKCALITPPVTHFYSDRVKPEKYRTMQTTVQRLSRRYGASYFNYMYDRRFRESDFGDYDHLRAEGAAKFSAILKDEIVVPHLHIKMVRRVFSRMTTF
ncbi:MAG: hypothetical protein M3347_18215 [Armatimonadota bacterium]|nr:hypothetical protein [Armatimonadota bacterium]